MGEQRHERPAAEVRAVDEPADGEEADERQQRAAEAHHGGRPAHALVPAVVDQHGSDQQRDEQEGDAAVPAERRGHGAPRAQQHREAADDERGPCRDKSGRNRTRRTALGVPARVERVVEDHPADVDERDAEKEAEERDEQANRPGKTIGVDIPEQPAAEEVAPDGREVRAAGEHQPGADFREEAGDHLREASRRAARARRASSGTPRRSCRRRRPRGLRAAGPPRYTSRSRARGRRRAPWR